MKKVLGLDLGTNSIGWALLNSEDCNFEKTGSRIIPMDAATMGDYEKGNLQSAAAARTGFRGTRRLYERAILRRERLLRVLNKLGFLPSTFSSQIDFEEHPGKFKNHGEPLLPYYKGDDGKNQFLFMASFNEMLADFAKNQPALVSEGRRVPYDWTIYYLRKKALTRAISKEELSWILLNFNTKRGYYQLRGMEDEVAETAGKKVEFMPLTVADVVDLGPLGKNGKVHQYQIVYDNGASQTVKSVVAPRNVGDRVEVIVTTTLTADGNVKLSKDGTPMISLRTPKDDDWQLRKKRTEYDLDHSGLTVGTFIYEHILAEPAVKVRGKLIHTIERRYYKDELRQILEAQKDFIPELSDPHLYEACVRELYKHNEGHVNNIKDFGFTKFFIDDVIFYQRPLKSKKSLIDDCRFETYTYRAADGTMQTCGVKCAPKSHPTYEEFRLWKFISHLRIYQREAETAGRLEMDKDVTSQFLSSQEAYCLLFDALRGKKDVSQDQLLKSPPFNLKKKEPAAYRWNYVEDKSYPCCPTRYEMTRRLSAIGHAELSDDKLIALWHIAYSVQDPVMYRKALRKFALKNGIDPVAFVKQFENFTLGSKDYGAYSLKALNRLLPLMRMGKYWQADDIIKDAPTLERINHIIDGVADENISDRTRVHLQGCARLEDFSALTEDLASYVVYNRHSEAADLTRWETPEDIDRYLQNTFKQHSLRNSVVEKVVGETLRLARDLWREYGKIDEVHVEMGRDLKNPADKRAAMSQRNLANQATNLRIRALLQEFANPEYKIENVRPNSPSQQELLKIFEDGILNDPTIEIDDDIKSIISDLGNAKTAHVSSSSVQRYRLWLEQKYKSPYTGQTIPLSQLFTTAYEIEHVIPQSRYFDDSLTNKVICESEVNKAKSNMLGYEFISKMGGSIIQCGGRPIHVLDKKQYEDFVQQHYVHNRSKMRKLLMEDIPDGFIERQMNDTRYMSRQMLGILSCLVREEGEQEAVSKHVIATTGAVTDRLKKDWGIGDVWNRIIAPRFERLNQLTGTSDYGQWVNRQGKQYFQINVPLELSAGFSKKRIDHRHHAMDAMVIACTTRNHVNYLNNISALSSRQCERHDLKHLLCDKVKTDAEGNYQWRFKQPWEGFALSVQQQLQGITVSFKQNLRVITRANNHFTHYVDGKKVVDKQTKGDGWAIRKSMHKATVSGVVSLQQVKTMRLKDALDDVTAIKDKELRRTIAQLAEQYHGFDKKTILKYFKDRDNKLNGKDVAKVEVYCYTSGSGSMSATRVAVDESFDAKKIEAVSDSATRKILLAHLENSRNADGKSDPKIAFSAEGIATMNRNIRQLNGGKDHKPIYKVRKTETLGMKFSIGEVGNKTRKFVEADKGTNLYFAVYVDDEGSRSYESIPLNVVIERRKQRLGVAEDVKPDGRRLLFTLSPNDLVVLDTADGGKSIYRMVSCNKKQCFFAPETWATLIVSDKDRKVFELGVMNKVEMAIEDGQNIKQVCHKITVDRLGRITKTFE